MSISINTKMYAVLECIGVYFNVLFYRSNFGKLNIFFKSLNTEIVREEPSYRVSIID